VRADKSMERDLSPEPNLSGEDEARDPNQTPPGRFPTPYTLHPTPYTLHPAPDPPRLRLVSLSREVLFQPSLPQLFMLGA
jgi:hypothetical protein